MGNESDQERGDPEFGKRLKDLREGAKLTQAALATAIGADASAVSRWERGEVMPQVKLLAKVAEKLATSLDYLVLGTGEAATQTSEEFAQFLATDLGQIAAKRGWLRFLARITPPGGRASAAFYSHVTHAWMVDPGSKQTGHS